MSVRSPVIRLTVDGALLEEAEVLELLAIPLRCVFGTVLSLTPAAPMLLLFGLKSQAHTCVQRCALHILSSSAGNIKALIQGHGGSSTGRIVTVQPCSLRPSRSAHG